MSKKETIKRYLCFAFPWSLGMYFLTLGTLPATEMASINLAKSHGTPHELPSGATLVPIFHPNYLILKPAAKRDVWTALQNVQNILKSAE